MTTLSCPSCGAAPRKQDLNPALGIAACAYCGRVFADASAPAPPAIDVPPALHVHRTPDSLTLRLHWDRTLALAVGIFLVFIDPFLLFMIANSIARRGLLSIDVFVLAGSFLAFLGVPHYLLAAFLLNRTTLHAANNRLTVRHGPLPWPGRRDLPLDQITAIFTTRTLYKPTKRPGKKPIPGGKTFAVRALLHDGTTQPLLTTLHQLPQALAIEHLLERHLQLRNLPIPNSISEDNTPTQLPPSSAARKTGPQA